LPEEQVDRIQEKRLRRNVPFDRQTPKPPMILG
jgi:hypothetical protein